MDRPQRRGGQSPGDPIQGDERDWRPSALPRLSGAGINPSAVDLASTDLEIINARGYSTSASTWYLRRFGFEARASYWDRNFILLMKLPLQATKSSPFPASLGKAQVLGIDFESGKLEINKPLPLNPNSITPTPSTPATPNPFAIPTLVPITLPTPDVPTGASSAPAASTSAPPTNRLGGPGAGEASEDPDKLSYWLAVDLATEKDAAKDKTTPSRPLP